MKLQIGFFFSELQGPSLIINLAQHASPSVALPAELVKTCYHMKYNSHSDDCWYSAYLGNNSAHYNSADKVQLAGSEEENCLNTK